MPFVAGGFGEKARANQPPTAERKGHDWSPYVNQTARVFKRAARVLLNRAGGVQRAHGRL
jgi:hypothetical protein